MHVGNIYVYAHVYNERVHHISNAHTHINHSNRRHERDSKTKKEK